MALVRFFGRYCVWNPGLGPNKRVALATTTLEAQRLTLTSAASSRGRFHRLLQRCGIVEMEGSGQPKMTMTTCS